MLFGFDLNRSDPYSLLLSSPSLSKFSPSKGSFFTSHVHQTLVNFHVIYGTFATFSWLSPFSMYKNLSNSPFLLFCAFCDGQVNYLFLEQALLMLLNPIERD